MNEPLLLIITSQNVVLPDHETPVPATIKADLVTGKIVEVILKHTSHADWTELQDEKSIEFLDVETKHILPGLVELGPNPELSLSH
jgi:allantoinase